MWDCVAMLVREKDPIGPSNVRASAVTAPSTAANSDLARPRNVAFGSRAAVPTFQREVSPAPENRERSPLLRCRAKFGHALATKAKGQNPISLAPLNPLSRRSQKSTQRRLMPPFGTLARFTL